MLYCLHCKLYFKGNKMKEAIQKQQFEFELKLRARFASQQNGGSSQMSHKVCDAWAGPVGERKNKRRK